MTESAAPILVPLAVYAGLGILFAAAFALRGAAAIDPALARSPAHVRLLLVPGAVALWPVLLMKWTRARTTP